MAKTLWIRAAIKGCTVQNGKIALEIRCGNFAAIGEAIYTNPLQLKDLPHLCCFVKGMVNSSQNALVRTEDSWGPLGRVRTRFDFKYGVAIHKIVNDFSRDGDIDCVLTRDDAEKICLLNQTFPCCSHTLLQIAEYNGFDVERLTARGLKTLELAVLNTIRKHDLSCANLQVDDTVKTMVIAGK